MSAVLDRHALAAHVLVALAGAARAGRTLTVADLAETVKVRRGDVRGIVSQLHAEGHVDALRMRLTLSGLALARAFAKSTLKRVRKARVTPAAVVAA
ncbi:MAG: Rrf2 family transcriptional regulator [Myxococcales bacterium]|nr:Rrf2 family transcriptional regulator [Myxococcales bacterium]MBL0197088.1 Rrf2 family transcriptional regulator [Myxococcales bacterium]HQY63951.1 hypothetical protein [Polyangiaceae bacterium]